MTSESQNPVPRASGGVLASAMGAFGNSGFVLCVALLLALAVGFQAWAKRNKISLKAKQAVALKQPLDRLDKRRLAPYEFVRHFTIESAMLGALGTDQYMHWLLEDTDIKDLSAPERYVTLFVTYYTGQLDPVPHVPEVCYVGGGHQLGRSYLEEVQVTLDGEPQTIPVKVVEFKKTGFSEVKDMIVLYTFSANGEFSAERNGVRMLVGDAGARYAYFSKVEVNFGTPENRPSEEVAVKAGRKFLSKVLPILMEDCWPDWDHELNAPATVERDQTSPE